MSGLHRICFTIRHWSAKIHADLIPHGPSGRSVIRSGSRCVCGMLDWQAMQVDTNLSHCESIPGNHTCALKSCFVRTWPWWPSCAISTIVCLSFAGKTIRSPLKTIPSTMVSSWKTCRNSFVLVSFVSSLYLGCPLTSGNFPHNSLPNWAWLGWLQLSHAQLLCMPWFPPLHFIPHGFAFQRSDPSGLLYCLHKPFYIAVDFYPSGCHFSVLKPLLCSSNLWLLKCGPLSDLILTAISRSKTRYNKSMRSLCY